MDHLVEKKALIGSNMNNKFVENFLLEGLGHEIRIRLKWYGLIAL
jgi:hypothetical protein